MDSELRPVEYLLAWLGIVAILWACVGWAAAVFFALNAAWLAAGVCLATWAVAAVVASRLVGDGLGGHG